MVHKADIGDTHSHASEGHHDPYLAHHFDTVEQQYSAQVFGMWLFIATEILLFGGLFCWYSVYRSNHPDIFQAGSMFLDKNLGALNTVILIFSSFTMAWAVRAAQLSQKKILIAMLTITVLCAMGFMVVKYVEYSEKWRHGLLWGAKYHYSSVEADHGDSSAPVEMEESAAAGTGHGESDTPRLLHLFFGIYFLMTGLHGIHVLVGIIIISWLIFTSMKGRWHSRNFVVVDLVGLYWHVVDIIWIFLFPLFYLIN